MSDAHAFDCIVIGTGQGGKPLALALAAAGRRTAVVERDHVGGSCVNYGCTPTKTMIASARVGDLAQRAGEYGVTAGPVAVDLARVRARKRAVVERFRRAGERGLEEAEGLVFLRGEASLAGPAAVDVRESQGRRRLTAPCIVINTGTRPAVPHVEGIDRVPWLDPAGAMELDTVPEHLVVIGGGYVGVEFAQMFRRFGSRVTIVQRGAQLLTREDPDVAEAVQQILTEDGIDLLVRADVRTVRRNGSGVEVDLIRAGARQAVSGSHLLIAAGRTPNTDTLNPSAAGVQADDRGYITVNERLETSVPGIYALGDVTGGPAFTHVSYDDFRVLRANLLDGGGPAAASTRGRLVPYVVFMDPQLARVGLGEQEARRAGREIRVTTLPMTHVARAIEAGETRGFMKAVVDARTKEILGCAVLGYEGGEVMAVLQVAMMGRLPYTALRDGVFAHPTTAEALNNLFATLSE